MNYGDRQKRAEMIVKAFRSKGETVFPLGDRTYTGEEIALEVEGETELGKSLVATAGLVLRAIESTPELLIV
jgi:hypothetical protein